MSIPAGHRRRSHIQWHDDGSAQHVRGFLVGSVSPLRALVLAAILGVFSVAAVVCVIQFQRHGGFEQVGRSLVDEARANPETQKPTLEAATASKVKAADAPVFADAAEGSPAYEVGAAVAPKLERIDVEAVLYATASVQVAAPTAERMGSTRDKIEATRDDELQEALAPLTTNDPRWQGVQTATIMTLPRELVADPQPASVPAAYARVEEPAAAPRPKPASQQKKTLVASVSVEPPAALSDAGTTANAKVKRSVFLRSRPADGSKILLTIPGGSRLQVASGCRHWCSVTYQGRQGFVYKSFLIR